MKRFTEHRVPLPSEKEDATYHIDYEERIAPPDTDTEPLEVRVEWRRIKNEFGEVEVSIYRQKGVSNAKAIFFLPGINGDTSTFKDAYVHGLISKEHADIILVHRNGAVFDTNAGAIASVQRSKDAARVGQDHLGGQDAYGYKEWVREFACAAEGLSDAYTHMQAIGHSLGGLIGLESLRLLKEKHSAVLSKIDTFLSLAGQIGEPTIDETNQVWIDPYRNNAVEADREPVTRTIAWSNSLRETLLKLQQDGVMKMKTSDEMVREYLEIAQRLYRDEDGMPASVHIIHMMPLLEKYFGPYQGRALAERRRRGKANFIFVNDVRAHGTPSERHSLSITPEELSALLHVTAGKSHTKVLSANGIEDASLDVVARHLSRAEKDAKKKGGV